MIESILVRANGQDVAVSAQIQGHLAIHESLDKNPQHFTVTHVPTKLAVRPGLSRIQAEELVRLLILTGIDWSFSDPLGAQELGDVVIPIVRSVLATQPKT